MSPKRLKYQKFYKTLSKKVFWNFSQGDEIKIKSHESF